MPTNVEIEELIARTALRDRRAFESLYDATSAKLFGVCLRVLRNRAEAEEALQEVYVRVWVKADSYAVTGHSPMSWLITVARNLSIDRLRLRANSLASTQGGTVATVDLADNRPGPEATAIASSEARRILACLGELEADRAAAIKGAYLDGATYQELADRFAIPLNTMRTWLRRSLQSLRECMSR
jgi:RNA polymerase sigma-70 factor, ECF subfamily